MDADTATRIHISSWIVFHVLLKKGVIAYADIQEAIAEVREIIPKEMYSQNIADALNIMEQTYQPGLYQSPLSPPDEPRP
jgi:hypothetical protein